MSSFETIQDAAFALKAEGQEIKISFKKGVPTTGQATVEWTIPKPAQGCESSDTGAYAGIVILLGTEAMDATNIPVDGTVYVADQTADSNLSVGDRIGDALVVGAVYECEEKARGETLTTSVVINDIDSQTGYYVAGYAVDCQNRYHSDGIRAYSDVFSNKEDGSIAASQEVKLGVSSAGVVPTDGTGLTAGVNYEFDLIYDNTFPEGQNWKAIPITIDGINAGTYQELLDEIRNDILLIDNPTQSPVPPNAGGFYWNPAEEKLFLFDGYTYTELDVLVEATDPALSASYTTRTYWYDTTNEVLKRWLGAAWDATPTPFLTSEIDPTTPDADSVWYTGGSPAIARTWNGTTWCDAPTFTQAIDPSDCPILPLGMHWFDSVTSVLSVWNEDLLKWDATAAIVWTEDPTNLSNGTYWYDDVALTLSLRSANAWSDITSTTKIQETAPTVVELVDGLLWYTPSTELLQKYQTGSPVGWVEIPVLVWEDDPTVITSCNLWWDTGSSPDILNTWDSVIGNWDQVAGFIQSATDPALAATIAVDSFWYNTTLSTLSRWDGNTWILETDYITKATDPTVPVAEEVWWQLSTNTWKYWDGSAWVVINTIESEQNPTVLATGTYWLNTTNTSLQSWNGVSWTNMLFVTQPYVFVRNSQWYNTTTNELFEWNGTTWITSPPVVDVAFTTSGHFLFWTRKRGSDTALLIPSPEGSTATSTPCSIGTGFAFDGVTDTIAASCEYANDGNVIRIYPARDIPDATFLWSNLTGDALVITPKGGNDGISGVPSYLEVGVGTDGTPDERRELMDTVRRQLGYPAVEVELDNVQLDTCVSLALEEYRKRASSAYRRGFYFLDIAPGKQQYLMTNKVIGYNRIVTVMAAYRFTSAFLSSAHGAGAYGQIVLQHLYNMGTYDLTSFFLVSQYVEQLEHLFATRLTFSWHENDRLLSFYNAFTRSERVLIDCLVERSEQDLLKDRYSKTWIERYTLSEAMMILSHIRGKFSALPGAGGGIALNSAELVTLSQSYREELFLQIEEYVADQGVEDVGMEGSFILG